MDEADIDIEDVFQEVKSDYHYNPGVRDPVTDFSSYIRSIGWTEPWLMCLMFFHMLMFIIVILSRRSIIIQAVLGALMLGTVYASEIINEFAAHHWRSFANEQYFDSKGMFISTVLSAPLLFNCLIIIMNFLIYNYYLLRDIQVMKARRINKATADKKSK